MECAITKPLPGLIRHPKENFSYIKISLILAVDLNIQIHISKCNQIFEKKINKFLNSNVLVWGA